MTQEIDALDGSLHLPNGIVLEHNSNFQKIVATGITLNRDLDMKNGWRLAAIGPSAFLGVLANFALLFFNDELKQVHFTLEQAGAAHPDQIRKVHDSVLMREFGVPQVRDAQKLMYVFPWGTLVSAYDPRGGQSEVVLSWK
jgi:hypothetical protein